MPTAGLSLVGFMADQQQAINHLRKDCVPAPPNTPDAVLIAEWQAAQAQRGPPIANAGHPGIAPIPNTHQQHVQQVAQAPWAQPMFAGQWQNATFQMAEIDSLLAFQFTVDTVRAGHHLQTAQNPPTLDDLFSICLPIALTQETTHFSEHITPEARSIVIRSRSLNFRVLDQGYFNQHGILGIMVGSALRAVQVVRLNGRCYLHNGFHRAIAARAAGFAQIPCVFRDVATLRHHMEPRKLPTQSLARTTKSGETHYLVKIELARDPDGKRRIHYETCATLPEAERAVRKVLNALEDNTHVGRKNLTVSAWLDTWLADYARLDLTASSFERYRRRTPSASCACTRRIRPPAARRTMRPPPM